MMNKEEEMMKILNDVYVISSTISPINDKEALMEVFAYLSNLTKQYELEGENDVD